MIMMKLLKIYIRPERANEVIEALQNDGFYCMTIIECRGTGNLSDEESPHKIHHDYPYSLIRF